MDSKIKIVILAAGKGTRLNCSDCPKVMLEIGGRAIVSYIVQTLFEMGFGKDRLALVVGFQKDKIKKMVTSEDVRHPHSDQKIVEMLQVDGIHIAPGIFTDANIKVNNSLYGLKWNSANEGINTVFEAPMVLQVNAGEELILSSDMKFDDTIYINFYYSFEADENSHEVKKPIERVYLSSDYEIFRVN